MKPPSNLGAVFKRRQQSRMNGVAARQEIRFRYIDDDTIRVMMGCCKPLGFINKVDGVWVSKSTRPAVVRKVAELNANP